VEDQAGEGEGVDDDIGPTLDELLDDMHLSDEEEPEQEPQQQ